MEALCASGDRNCEAHALAAALHSLHLYCAAVATALICCCAPLPHSNRRGKHWRGQNVRGVASLILGVVWCCGAVAGSLRPARTVPLIALTLAPLGWLAAAALHVALWTRRSVAPVLYLAVYWLLAAAAAAAVLYQSLSSNTSKYDVALYIQGSSIVLALLISAVDCLCFYDEIAKRYQSHEKSSSGIENVSYKHSDTHFYSKITFFWLNPLLRRGYESPLEANDLGELPEDETSNVYYQNFKRIFKPNTKEAVAEETRSNIWTSYLYAVWPNFYTAGLMKLLGDLISVVPPIGLAIIIQQIEGPLHTYNENTEVTVHEFFSNGHVMLLIVTMALIFQALLSQNSTHLVTVEGSRLKAGLQGLLFDKCMRLAPWSSAECNVDEESPLLHSTEGNRATPSGVLTNLMSQDTYNIMSCVWVCHYLWAIPLKVSVILYLLYTKLGVSALIGTTTSIIVITPLQCYIGKKISENSKDVSKCTDHRISKMTEILQGMNVIKLYVWEDLFNEKILNLREVELKLLNKDSIYWGFLTFTTQVSTILVTVVTFVAYYFLNDSKGLTAVNVFAGLALFNQLTVPLLILPVTVLMVIQAMVSTKRITDFLELPESNNVGDDDITISTDIFNEAFIDNTPEEEVEDVPKNEEEQIEDRFSDDDNCDQSAQYEYEVRFRNVTFSWGVKNDMVLEVDDLDIPAGKFVMVVGASGSGKSSLLSAILGEMYLTKGDVLYRGQVSTYYAGQPPWLMEGSVRENILMGSPWCPRRYSRVLRAAALRPDLRLLPEGDATRLGSHGSPLSGGQRVRVCIARLLYSKARLLVLDEPLAALDAPLARHVVARALVSAARAGRTVLIATNRLELLHYADLVGISETAGAHLLTEVPTCAGGSWRRVVRQRPALERQLSSPPPSVHNYKWRREVRRAVSADASNVTLQREASLLRRLLRPRPHRTLTRWTPRTLRRLISSDSETTNEENGTQGVSEDNVETTYASLTSNGTDVSVVVETDNMPFRGEIEDVSTEASAWSEYALACGWWGATYWAAAVATQTLAVLADYWLTQTTEKNAHSLSDDEVWASVRTYAAWCAGAACAGGAAGAAGGAAGARARRRLHERLVRAALHAPLAHHARVPPARMLHTFSADVHVVDRKLPIAVTRWAQLALLCSAAVVVNAVTVPWTLLALVPAILLYFVLQAVYLNNARELQRMEAMSAAGVVSLAAEASAGASCVRAGRLQAMLRARLYRRLDRNCNTLLLLNAANRWLGLSM
ncbi:hypothetical protein ACJJTC_001421, partial [Scirpophaga incertulas]